MSRSDVVRAFAAAAMAAGLVLAVALAIVFG